MASVLPMQPYLLRAWHEWITDCGHTPYVLINAEHEGAEVPRAHVKDGKIVLNLSLAATQRLKLGNEEVEFDARFSGVIHHVRFPVTAVMRIYPRERPGAAMVFSDLEELTRRMDGDDPHPPTPPTSPPGEGRRPQLKVVK